jgi:hypothetical protein
MKLAARLAVAVVLALTFVALTAPRAYAWPWDRTVSITASGHIGSLFPGLRCANATLVLQGRTYTSTSWYNGLLNTCNYSFRNVPARLAGDPGQLLIGAHTMPIFGRGTYVSATTNVRVFIPVVGSSINLGHFRMR